ncbi:MAG: metallophosphatase family protein [Thermoflexales bacterium]|nr:metallophosphatase family protein [Thermoflexales bacterium]MCS7325427.1 metallophosphatase family protein [Thermoflexales bacterium]MCX7939080.1 metallophosphatase family protein [Thermoflexales bacterium]MDW8054056.1 metallophosphoesterase family protein [Anaerolineae bacterium]MDW8292609.1 metallophosphoesterase family protein [Anaerolineae bacterium]
MRYLVLSDIHANLAAFEAVLRDVKHRHVGYDAIWFLGDLVGYGPEPNECVEQMRALAPAVSLAGNHDWAVLGKIDVAAFHDLAADVVNWTREVLTAENRAYLQDRPTQATVDDFLLVHASPREPVWEYVLDPATALANFAVMGTPYALVGHSHLPLLFVTNPAQPKERPRAFLVSPNTSIFLRSGLQYILNPGSVGQPRDQDPRAAYAVLDTEARTWTLYRTEYPVQHTQAKMRALGFAEPLIVRLQLGR